MEFWKAIFALVRQWSFTVPLIAVAVVLAAATYVISPTHFVASRTLLLTTPPSGGAVSLDPDKPVGQINPLLYIGESQRMAVSLIILTLQGDGSEQSTGGTSAKILDGGSAPQLLGVQGPYIYIEGDSTVSPDAAHSAVEGATTRVKDMMVELQRTLGAPQSTFVSVLGVTDRQPVAQSGKKITRSLEVLGVILLAGVLGGYWNLRTRWVDRLLRRLRRLGPRRFDGTYGGRPDGSDPQVVEATSEVAIESFGDKPVVAELQRVEIVPADEDPHAEAPGVSEWDLPDGETTEAITHVATAPASVGSEEPTGAGPTPPDGDDGSPANAPRRRRPALRLRPRLVAAGSHPERPSIDTAEPTQDDLPTT